MASALERQGRDGRAPLAAVERVEQDERDLEVAVGRRGQDGLLVDHGASRDEVASELRCHLLGAVAQRPRRGHAAGYSKRTGPLKTMPFASTAGAVAPITTETSPVSTRVSLSTLK